MMQDESRIIEDNNNDTKIGHNDSFMKIQQIENTDFNVALSEKFKYLMASIL